MSSSSSASKSSRNPHYVEKANLPQDLYLPFAYTPLVPERRYCGAYSDAQIYSRKGTGPATQVAIKRMRRTSDVNDETDEDLLKFSSAMDTALEKEITVLMRFRHENILGFLGLTREHPDASAQPLIVTPYAKNGTLLRYLAAKETVNVDRKKLIRGVAAGLKYLHTLDEKTGKTVIVVHGDLHPRNVLIMEDGRAVLADFGLCKIVEQGGATSFSFRPGGTAAGLAKYIAPEVHDVTGQDIKPAVANQGEYAGRRTVKSDVFAFGMLLFDVYGGDAAPALGKQDMVITTSLIKGKRPARGDITRKDFPGSYWRVIEDCWRAEAAKRPAIERVCEAL